MSSSPGLEDLEPAQRDALRGLLRDERLPRGGVELARRALAALGGDGDEAPPAAQRDLIGDYLVGRLSPGRAEGLWRLLSSDPAAARWAQRVRDALAAEGLQDPPPLPGDDGALSPAERFRGRAPRRDGASLGERRRERARRRTAANAQQAAAELMSPYRSEALRALEQADERTELPRWAPRPIRLAMYGVLAMLLAGLAFCIFVRIPVNTNALVLVSSLPPGSPGSGAGGIHVLALFAQDNGQSKDTGSGADVRVGDVLRVALPGERNRTPMRLRWVSDGPRPPREVIDGYRLALGQANRVVAPAFLATAPLRPPGGKPPRAYEGTTTGEASVQTGSRRIISLLF